MQKPQDLLKKLGLSDSEGVLYLAMLAHGAMSAQQLVKLTKGKRPTVYYALKQLLTRGLVKTIATHGIQRFQAEPPESLLTLIELQEQELQSLKTTMTEALPLFGGITSQQELAPKVTFFEGEEAMKRVVMETLYCRQKHIDSIAPRDNFFWQVGQVFSQQYIDERVRRKITTRNLWEQPLKPEIMTRSYKGVSQVRILPEVMHGAFRSTLFLYDNKVMMISSLKNGHVLLVESEEYYQTMKAMYEGLWTTSKEV